MLGGKKSLRWNWTIFLFGFAMGIISSYIYFKNQETRYLKLIQTYIEINKLYSKELLEMNKVLKYKHFEPHQKIIEGNMENDPVRVELLCPTSAPPTQKNDLINPSNDETSFDSNSDHSMNEVMHLGEDLVAKELAKKVRILCFVLTSPNNHKTRAIHVKRTWGKRCNILLFVSTKKEKDLEPQIIVENIKESRVILWTKTKTAIKEIYKKYLDKADWFLKADDDTYIVMENLRFMLQDYDTNQTHYFGHTFSPSWYPFSYQSGGAGYVLSRATIKRLVEEAFPATNQSICAYPKTKPEQPSEDVEVGRCIKSLNISISDSRDSLDRMRFFPFPPLVHIIQTKLNSSKYNWWYAYAKYAHQDGLECCSDTAVGFHYVKSDEMYLFEYFLYHLRPYGISHNPYPMFVNLESQSTTISP